MDFDISSAIPSSQFSLLTEFMAWMDGEGDADSTSQRFVAHLVQSVSITIFALIDALYNLTAAILKLPFVAFKVTIANLLGVSDQMPDTLGPTDWLEHVKRVFTCAIAVISSATLGIVTPETVVALCQKMGLNYSWINELDD